MAARLGNGLLENLLLDFVYLEAFTFISFTAFFFGMKQAPCNLL
jgi:hypothetical protein